MRTTEKGDRENRAVGQKTGQSECVGSDDGDNVITPVKGPAAGKGEVHI